jgi:predicted dehydrogenase
MKSAMKALIVGLGSAGKRHARVLKEIVDVEIIALRRPASLRDKSFSRKCAIQELKDARYAISKRPDFAIIANSTAHHIQTALLLARAGIPFLLEKPVSSNMEGVDSLSVLVKRKKLPVLVGFQMRHHLGYKKMVQWVTEGRIGKPLHCHGYVGQYLPEWKPDSDYRKSYSALKKMGGGVILDLCHQIDIHCSLLGRGTEVACICGRLSDLTIETEDSADIVIKHGKKSISHIHLNYFERDYEWYTRVTGSEGTIIWDYGKGVVTLSRPGKACKTWGTPRYFTRDELFTCQMRHWLNVLSGKETPAVSLDEGIHATRLAILAKKSSATGRCIAL